MLIENRLRSGKLKQYERCEDEHPFQRMDFPFNTQFNKMDNYLHNNHATDEDSDPDHVW